MLYRLEKKQAVPCAKRIGNANIFEPIVMREAAESRLIDELLMLLGGRTRPVMAHLARTGKLTAEDVKEAQALLRQLDRSET